MELIGRKTLWEGRFLKTMLISYKDRGGKVREWEAVGRVNSDGIVIIIPVIRDNELILIRQYRPVLDSFVIELPAGLIDVGEDIISAGRRELIEETGYTSDNIVMLTEGVMSTGIDTDKWRILLAQDVYEVNEEVRLNHIPDENEDIEIIRVPSGNMYEELEKLSGNGDKIDLRIMGLWELAKRIINEQ